MDEKTKKKSFGLGFQTGFGLCFSLFVGVYFFFSLTPLYKDDYIHKDDVAKNYVLKDDYIHKDKVTEDYLLKTDLSNLSTDDQSKKSEVNKEAVTTSVEKVGEKSNDIFEPGLTFGQKMVDSLSTNAYEIVLKHNDSVAYSKDALNGMTYLYKVSNTTNTNTANLHEYQLRHYYCRTRGTPDDKGERKRNISQLYDDMYFVSEAISFLHDRAKGNDYEMDKILQIPNELDEFAGMLPIFGEQTSSKHLNLLNAFFQENLLLSFSRQNLNAIKTASTLLLHFLDTMRDKADFHSMMDNVNPDLASVSDEHYRSFGLPVTDDPCLQYSTNTRTNGYVYFYNFWVRRYHDGSLYEVERILRIFDKKYHYMNL